MEKLEEKLYVISQLLKNQKTLLLKAIKIERNGNLLRKHYCHKFLRYTCKWNVKCKEHFLHKTICIIYIYTP